MPSLRTCAPDGSRPHCEGPTLTQQIPADVATDLHVVQPSALLVGQASVVVGLMEDMLLDRQSVNALEQVLVGHRHILVARGPMVVCQSTRVPLAAHDPDLSLTCSAANSVLPRRR